MKNSFAQQLMAARNRGVEYGLKGMAMIAIIMALPNCLYIIENMVRVLEGDKT